MMTFNKNRAGQVVQMVNGQVYVWRPDGKYAYASAYDGAVVTVTLTGWTKQMETGTTMYQCTNTGWIDLMDGWQARGFENYGSVKTAQAYVNEIIANNKTILENNLVCARFAYKLSTAQRNQLRELQNRLVARNESLIRDGLVSNVETSYPQGYADLAASLTDFMAEVPGVGVVISTTAVIVVSAIVVASLSTAAYFAYRYMCDESKYDVRYSKELTRTLTSKLTPEEYEQLKNETAGIVTKARIRQSLSNFGVIGKTLLIAGLGFGAYYLYKKIQS